MNFVVFCFVSNFDNLGIVQVVVSSAIWASFEWLFQQQFGASFEWLFHQQFGHRSSGCFGRNLGIVRQKITSVKVLNDRIQ